MDAEFMAKLFHDKYEKLAPSFGYKTRDASAKPWFDIPENNRKLMIAVAGEILSVQQRQAEDNPTSDRSVVEVAYDVFTRVRRWKMRLIKWIWPDIKRLADSLYDHWAEID